MTSRYIGARVKSLGFLVFRVSAFVTSGMLGRRFAEEARAVRDACSLLDPRHFRVCVHVCVCDGFVFDGYGQYVSFVLLAEDRVIIVMHNHA